MNRINVGIKSIGSVSPLGNHRMAQAAYLNAQHYFSQENNTYQAKLHTELKTELDVLIASDKRFKSLDRSTLLGMMAAKQAMKKSGWEQESFGVAMGTSRGAAETLEKSHQIYLNEGNCPTATSPLTTMGNISYWIGEYIQANGLELSHSVTCSSSFHSILTAISWLEAGWQRRFIVGGTEAPLTPFFLQQMKALRIYSSPKKCEYPNRSLDIPKNENTMILGEGASCIAIEKTKQGESYIGRITGIGFATEPISHHTSISERGENIHQAMKMATKDVDLKEIDVIIMHAPGTVLGDQAEINAAQDLFGDKMPLLTSNKWKIGHTLGASGMLSIEMGLIMLAEKTVFNTPFVSSPTSIIPEKILINSMGFGGNAVSVLLEK